MKKYLCKLTFVIFVLTSIPVVQANINPVEIISSSDQEFHCLIPIDIDQLDYFIGEDSQIIYYKAVQIGVPYGSNPQITSVDGSNALSFKSHLKSNNKIASGYPLAKLSKPFSFRNNRMVTVTLFPVNFNSIYSEIDLKINFNNGNIESYPKKNDRRVENILRSTLLNYEQSKQFGLPVNQLSKPTLAPGPFTGSSVWYKIKLDQTSLYKLTGSDLVNAGISISTISPDDIHLFYGGGRTLDVLNKEPRSEFKEIAVLISDGGDGSFDAFDEILFFGEATNRWIYSPDNGPLYQNNIYEESNCYWLNISNSSAGLRMSQIDASLGGIVSGQVDTTISSYKKYFRIEQDNLLRRMNDGKITDYYNWYWSDENKLSFFIPTDGIITSDSVMLNLVGRTLDTTGTLDDIGYIDLFINDVKGLEKSCHQFGCTYKSLSFTNGLNKIDLDLWTNSSGPANFDYMELNYKSNNIPVNDKLDLTIGKYSGNAEMNILETFSDLPLILKVNDPYNPILMVDYDTVGSTTIFHDRLSGSEYNRYFIMPLSAAITPRSIKAVETVDLYQSTTQTDLIVIAPRFMLGALSDYVSFRSLKGYAITLTALEDIYDNFSFGQTDPTAVRDYLKFAYENYPSPVPFSALLVGDGNYDFLNRLGHDLPNYVPPFIHQYDVSSSDDNYVYFGDYGILDSDTSYTAVPDEGLDMIIARWPVKTSSEIASITNKIIGYGSNDNFGSWRNNFTLVADDEYGTFDNEIFHTTQTEDLEQNHLPGYLNRDKIYLWEYPFVGNHKPLVNDAIVESINNGTLVVNYVGHGNPNLWAHENVFNRSDDLPRLTNNDRLPLFFAASCAIGFFDDPAREGMAEDLLSMSSGGAIGVISATRLVYSSDNAAFNRKVYDVLLYNDSMSICEAVYTAKLQRQYIGINPIPQRNDRNYLFFGDPLLKLAKASQEIEFTSAPDSLIALNRTAVSGRVIDQYGQTILSNGTISVDVFDSQRDKTYRLVDPSGQVTQTVDYSVNGPSIFRGEATVNNGQFSFEFIPPVDIGFGGDGARITAYAVLDTIDAAGAKEGIRISETIANISDSVGPQILVSFDGIHEFNSGDMIRSGEKMMLTFSDSSGINLTGGLGHGITMEIDEISENIVNLTPLFEYDTDDFMTGRIEYNLDDLTIGNHRLKIKVWDNANNSTGHEFDVEIFQRGQFAVRNLLNYPNPMKEQTTFSFELTAAVDRLKLDIFTLSGRKIKTVERSSLEPGFYDDIIWYGEDFAGDRVATQVYIYKVTAFHRLTVKRRNHLVK